MKSESLITQVVDITPTPRILRTLGDIPFAAWQCLAELTDNSLDAFSEAENKGKVINGPRVDIHWSSDSVAAYDREIVVQDNGLGMELEVLQKAAKAGYSSNDPIHNLGLFGMGFNIATARLGDETLFLSATPDGTEWVGIKISFEQLIKEQTFSAPVVREPKKTPDESGTKIIVKSLKDGVFAEIRKKESAIRRQLETIYTPILSRKKVSIFVQGKQLSPRPHCVWSDSRFVVRKGVRVEAIQRINRDLGETYFDSLKNRYLTEDEAADLDVSISKGGVSQTHIVKRARRLKGWIGIQRYADPSDFGVDFVRNGRKILVSDKSLFGYENPDTGTYTSEYPVELGSTVGGRIVGGFLGIDLGIVNLAADSDGQQYSGEQVEDQRRKYQHRRRNLQRKGTRAAKRKLRQISGKQQRYQTDTNHRISKRIVQTAQDTGRGIALEDLKGIRDRVTVRRKQRARHANWAFHQLRQFIEYKAALAGVPVVAVDPRNTSRTCPVCGCVDKRNRPDQCTFSCVSCGYSANADTTAAANIAARAVVNQPNGLIAQGSAAQAAATSFPL